MPTLRAVHKFRHPIKLVTFDAFHTLYEPRGTIGSHYAAALKPFGITADSDQVDAAFRQAFAAHLARYSNYGSLYNMTSKLWWSVNRDIMGEVCNSVYELFATAKPYQLYPETAGVLRRLQQRNIKVGVISNSDERSGECQVLWAQTGMSDFFA
ncbi:hypothetical protein H4R34_001476 [Dimargaris verticillata]|uniref:HAD-like domain-containing protein n=1 Tax=Dimargaris verticillata TaxID=2761393 RepID=A0A9W8BBB2_9FUNG|nr:hypothetical protein H4R34_001476 [Dimargaris verticillata]